VKNNSTLGGFWFTYALWRKITDKNLAELSLMLKKVCAGISKHPAFSVVPETNFFNTAYTRERGLDVFQIV